MLFILFTKRSFVSKSQIPDWITANQIDLTEIIYNEVTYPVYVLDRELEPKLPGFMGFNKELKILFISEDVPEKWRQYVLRHELREYVDLASQAGRCVTSLVAELQEVPPDEREVYLVWRHAFFVNLVAYYDARKDADPELVRHIGESLAHLELLLLPEEEE
jgi:hypothetical protein